MSDLPHATQILRACPSCYMPISDNDYMARGRIVDRAADLLAQGKKLSPDWLARHTEGPHEYRDGQGQTRTCNCRPYIAGLEKFLGEHDFALLEAHTRIENTDLGYTTEPDWICILNGKVTVLDIKSGQVPSKSGAFHIWGLQVAGQKLAIHSPSDGLPRFKIEQRAVLNVRDDGGYLLFLEHKNPEIFSYRDEDAFIILTRAWHIRQSMER